MEIKTSFTSAKNLRDKINREMYSFGDNVENMLYFQYLFVKKKKNDKKSTGNEFVFMLNTTLHTPAFEKDYLSFLINYLRKYTFYSKHKI